MDSLDDGEEKKDASKEDLEQEEGTCLRYSLLRVVEELKMKFSVCRSISERREKTGKAI